MALSFSLIPALIPGERQFEKLITEAESKVYHELSPDQARHFILGVQACIAIVNKIPRQRVVERAATVRKAMELLNMPGADEVMVKLNMEPSHYEKLTADSWLKLFQFVHEFDDLKAFELAARIRHGQ
jgi:hypothetical protein